MIIVSGDFWCSIDQYVLVVVGNRAQRCDCHKLAGFWWVGGCGLACRSCLVAILVKNDPVRNFERRPCQQCLVLLGIPRLAHFALDMTVTRSRWARPSVKKPSISSGPGAPGWFGEARRPRCQEQVLRSRGTPRSWWSRLQRTWELLRCTGCKPCWRGLGCAPQDVCVHSGPVVPFSKCPRASLGTPSWAPGHQFFGLIWPIRPHGGDAGARDEARWSLPRGDDELTGSCRRMSQFFSHPPSRRPLCACKMTGRLVPTGPRTLPRRLLRCKCRGATASTQRRQQGECGAS